MKTTLAFALLSLMLAGAALAHTDKPHDSGPNLTPARTAFGRTGDAKNVARTIRVTMRDTMRFEPAQIVVRQGDTVRLVVANAGKVLHELVIGTDKELAEHAELMKKHPGMEHDEPYMAHVAAGKKGEVLWQFTEAGTFKFACLIPGHFEAGMVGTIVVEPRSASSSASSPALSTAKGAAK
jgi:uncharacterized cupredoxin-like copper-binding protein